MFCVFVAITLVVTYMVSGRTTTGRGFYAADRKISGVSNGWAIAGDYMSAASFLGITGLVAFYGFDGFMYSVGWLVAYLAVLFWVAEALRNAGKYTLVDVISFRLHGRGVRAVAAISTLAVTLFYMIAQMVGAGALVELLFPQVQANFVIIIVGLLMVLYVLIGGMLATTWVQVIKAGLLIVTAIALCVLVLGQYHWSIGALFTAATAAPAHAGPQNLLVPGLRFNGTAGALDLISLGLALVLGTAGLPHILMRFFTVPTAKAARTSVAWAMALIGAFYLSTSIMGLGAATLVGKDNIGRNLTDTLAIRYIAHHPDQAAELNHQLATKHFIAGTPNSNLAVPLLSAQVGGQLFEAFVLAVAFATILAVMAGLTIAASSAFAHDIWWNLIRNGQGKEKEYVLVARASAVVVGLIAILLSVFLKSQNVAFLVGLAFAVAASANVPALILSLTWRRFSRAGALFGMIGGLVSSLGLIALSPVFLKEHALFPLENPGLVSIPIGFLFAIAGTLIKRDPESETHYDQLHVRAQTGIGAEL